MRVYDVLTSLGDSIRAKTGRGDKMSLYEMAEAVEGISSPLPSVVDGSVEEICGADLAWVTEVRNYAFYGCSELRSVELPETVTKIGTYAFHSCAALSDITLHEGIVSLGTRAFQACGELRRMVIPSTLTAIPAYAFFNSGIETLILHGDTVKTLAAMSAFNGTPLVGAEDPTVYISTVKADPEALAAEYSEATNWAGFFSFRPVSDISEAGV